MYNTTPPDPPLEMTNEAIHKHLLDLNIYLKGMSSLGLQTTQIPSTALDEMVSTNDLSQSGKMFYDMDNNVMKKAIIVAGNLTIETF